MPGADITPVVLTHDEEDNLARTLESLGWAQSVVVVDSGSRDRTESIARSFANVVFDVHPFEGFDRQWRHAFAHAAVQTDYVLALDADMAVEPGLVVEMDQRVVAAGASAGRTRFRYVVGGRRLLGSLYPPDVRLLRRSQVTVEQVGHGHRFRVQGPVVALRGRLIHDDRKPWERFVASQVGYARREHERIVAGRDPRFRDRLRKLGWMPPLIGTLAWLKAGGPLKGRAAIRYAHERALFETLLALRLASDEQRTRPERVS